MPSPEPSDRRDGWCHCTGSIRKMPRYGPSGEVIDPGWIRDFDRWTRFGLPPPDWKEPEDRPATATDAKPPEEPQVPYGFRG